MTDNLELNESIAYLIGAISGDGHISNSSKSKEDNSKDYCICLESEDFSFVNGFARRILTYIETRSRVVRRSRKNKKKDTYYFQLRNKGFYLYLTVKLGLPKGRKSHILRVPFCIIRAGENIQRSFLAGLFDADGGIRGRNMGFTMSNKYFMKDVKNLLKVSGISSSSDRWFNKKYNRTYYGIRLNREETVNFLNKVPISNKEKLGKLLAHIDYLCGDAGAVKRDR